MSESLWTFADLVEAVGGRPVGPAPDGVTGISIDSRTLRPGDVFFAIRGERFDGHDFVGPALAAGAAAAVVAADKLAGFGAMTGALVVVGDVLEALAALGRAARWRTRATVAAVTGSVGKTGTKEMLARALAVDGEVHASPASFNNHWGVPLTLARMPPSARFAVLEIGMNHAGEIAPLSQMARPDVAIVTTVEPVHLEFFDSVEAIARAKAEIFLGVAPGGVAVLNRDNPHFDLLAHLADQAGVSRIIGFGEHPDAEAQLQLVKLKPDCSCVSASILGVDISYKLGAPGRHVVQNSLAVLAAVSVIGADLARAALVLGDMAAPSGRGARHRLEIVGHSAMLIDESYNANPASMRAAIALLGQTAPGAGGHRIAVLGDMRELGPEAQALHAGLAAPLIEAGVDTAYLAGPLMESLWQALPQALRGGHAATAAELEPLVTRAVGPGDVVMIKGSLGSRMGPLVDTLKRRYASAPPVAADDRGREIA